MSMFLYDLRKGRKFGVLTILALVGFCTICVGFVAVWYQFLNPDRDSLDAGGMPKVPLEMYVPATYEAFGCFADGPSVCEQFPEYVESVSASPVAFTYTPRTDSDPGTLNADGTRTITLDDALTPEQWQAVGAAVTQGQTLQGTQVNTDDADIDGSIVIADIPSTSDPQNTTQAHIEFQFAGNADNPSSVRVVSVIYSKEGAG